MPSFKKYFADSSDDFPAGIRLIINVLGFILVFAVSSCVAPIINEKFEQQEKQSAFYQLYFESFNADSKDFFGKFSVYIANSETDSLDINHYNELRELIARMQLRVLELFIILQRDEAKSTLGKYQASLNNFIPYIEEAYKGKIGNRAKLREEVDEFALQTANLIKMLAIEANVIKEKPSSK